MSTRPEPTRCHCIPHANARRRETTRAALWSALILAGIYLPAYIVYYALGVRP